MSIRVVVTDEQTGDTETVTVPDGDYFLVCTEPCHLAHVQSYPTKGTHVLTIKGRTGP
jgi:hypothetical protein